MREKIINAFHNLYGADPEWITFSPGRVNIIGEHTDYNDGFVLPMPIHFQTWVACRPRKDSQVRITALNKDNELVFDLTDYSHNDGGWEEYIKGVAWALQEEGYELGGWEGVFAGDIPIGAGLSSSASLELALARAFFLTSDLEWDPKQIALACQKAENHWVGINSGIMDQMVSVYGEEDHALLIDCRSLETRQIPLPEGVQIVILDTDTRRDLADSEYNERRAQCEATACYFNVSALRDLSLDTLEDKLGLLNQILYNRAKHVITANQRVLEAEQAMINNDPAALGLLMNTSHDSMRDDFEISRNEIDLMVSIAQSHPGCFGARMTGGGFGGCVIALVAEDQVKHFQSEVARKYQEKTGLSPKIYPSYAVNGTGFEVYKE